MEMKVQSPSVPSANAGSAMLPAAGRGAPQLKPASQDISPSVVQPPSRETTSKRLQQTVDELQRKVQVSAPNLQFSIDHDTGRTVIKVTDANTNEVIRQIPAEEMLRLAKEIDRMRGLLLHKQG